MTEPDADETLQRYFDGDLPPKEAEALRLRLDGDAELQAKLDGLTHLRTLLRAALAPERLEALDPDAMFRSIEGSLASDDEEDAAQEVVEVAPTARPAALPGRLRVLPGGVAPAEKDAEVLQPVRSRTPLWLGVGGVTLAAAAALWFFVLRPGTTDGPPDGDPDPIVMAAPTPGSEIEQIDFGHSTGAIFQVEDEGAQYAVVWISDEKPEDLDAPDDTPDPPEDRIQ